MINYINRYNLSNLNITVDIQFPNNFSSISCNGVRPLYQPADVPSGRCNNNIVNSISSLIIMIKKRKQKRDESE